MQCFSEHQNLRRRLRQRDRPLHRHAQPQQKRSKMSLNHCLLMSQNQPLLRKIWCPLRLQSPFRHHSRSHRRLLLHRPQRRILRLHPLIKWLPTCLASSIRFVLFLLSFSISFTSRMLFFNACNVFLSLTCFFTQLDMIFSSLTLLEQRMQLQEERMGRLESRPTQQQS